MNMITEQPNKLLVSFSIPKNLQQLLKIQHGHIPCLHGIRCLSLFWIIFLHCYLYRILSPNINAVDIKSVSQLFKKIIASNKNNLFCLKFIYFYIVGTNAIFDD